MTDGTREAALPPIVSRAPCPTVYKTKLEGQHETKRTGGQNRRGMGKSARYTPTRELLRFHWLLRQLEDSGVTQKQVIELTGIKKSHLTQIVHYERYRKTGVGAEWIGLMTKGLHLDPAYFFDEYDGQKDFRLYLLSAKRDEKRVQSIETRLQTLELRDAEKDTRLAELREKLLEKTGEVDRLRAELRRPRPKPLR